MTMANLAIQISPGDLFRSRQMPQFLPREGRLALQRGLGNIRRPDAKGWKPRKPAIAVARKLDAVVDVSCKFLQIASALGGAIRMADLRQQAPAKSRGCRFADREIRLPNTLFRRTAFARRFMCPDRIPFRSASQEFAPSLQPSALNLCSMPPRSIRFVPRHTKAR